MIPLLATPITLLAMEECRFDTPFTNIAMNISHAVFASAGATLVAMFVARCHKEFALVA